ncbi:hypothetical protein L1987_42570 [Smallanthus sonchifolius]|uniref:Uncharacterized protein n=1 Tax=Smallanthus sonchifolius TaxID=185202 RepID=A0ACB9GJV8_9ASTR|nr:hypothetical protein L1987_42570 [Smallanthus sonchifolius]
MSNARQCMGLHGRANISGIKQGTKDTVMGSWEQNGVIFKGKETGTPPVNSVYNLRPKLIDAVNTLLQRLHRISKKFNVVSDSSGYRDGV